MNVIYIYIYMYIYIHVYDFLQMLANGATDGVL